MTNEERRKARRLAVLKMLSNEIPVTQIQVALETGSSAIRNDLTILQRQGYVVDKEVTESGYKKLEGVR